jgi:hypothetical protein
MGALLEKRAFVLARNPHLYRVSNRYKASGTNLVEHLYQARYLIQMPQICTGWCLGLVQMCPPPGDVVGGIWTGWRYHLVQMLVFFCFLFIFPLTYLFKVLILIVIRCNIKSCGI